MDANGVMTVRGAVACVACAAGFFKTYNNVGCVGCPAGKYGTVTGGTGNWAGTPAAGVCIDCTIGKYSDTVGSATESDCIGCPEGFYTEEPFDSWSYSTSSIATINGTNSCSSITNQLTVHNRHPAYPRLGTGLTSAADCLRCVPGCTYEDYSSRECTPRTADCEGVWTACSSECVRTYTVIAPPAHGGALCNSSTIWWNGTVHHLATAECTAGERDGICTPAFHATAVGRCEPQIIETVVESIVVEYKTKVEYVNRPVGCDGTVNSGLTPDACGVCGGMVTEAADCTTGSIRIAVPASECPTVAEVA
eukprot:SAG31_NODE_10629_length_1115_cov_1.085630_1_plen_307_part_01